MVLMSALKTQVSTHHYISKDDLVPLSALKTQVSTHHYISKDDLVPLSALKTQVSTHHYISKTWYLCQPSKHKSQLTIILARMTWYLCQPSKNMSQLTIIFARMTWYLCQPSKDKSQLTIILERTTSIILSLFELFGFLFYCVFWAAGIFSRVRFPNAILPDRVHRLHQTWSCALSSSLLSIEIDLKKKQEKKKAGLSNLMLRKRKKKCLQDSCVNCVFQPTCFWINTGCTCVYVNILNHAASMDVFHCKKT